MTEGAVGMLYDALHSFEARRGRGGAYPVHKSLRFASAATQDIYDWIIDRIDLGNVRNALDAGCGVGFGSIRLAEQSNASVTGISVSEAEIAHARIAAERKGLSHRTAFRTASFDEMPALEYDLIVAVESLKHSGDLARSLRSLGTALVPGGKLIVVEDLVRGDGRCASARALARDWGLEALRTEADYIDALGAASCTVLDLTAGVRRGGPFSIATRLAVLHAALAFTPSARSRAVLRAFRGGLHLERLYASGAMTYKCVVYTKGN